MSQTMRRIQFSRSAVTHSPCPIGWVGPFRQSWMARRPPTTGSDEFTSVSLKLLDDHTIEESDRRGGKVVKISRWSVGSDGKTMHVRFDDMQRTCARANRSQSRVSGLRSLLKAHASSV